MTDLNQRGQRGPRQRGRGESGFSLIELLIAMTVLLIGLVSLLGLQQSSFRAAGFSRHATEAAVIGEDALETQLAIAYDSVASQAAVAVDGSGRLDADGFFTRQVDVVDNVNNTKTVTVTVSWDERGDPKAFVFTTLVSP